MRENKIIEKKDFGVIVLHNRFSEETGRAIIDLEDIPLILELKWNLIFGAAFNAKNNIYLAQFLLEAPKGSHVLYADNNRLNCQKVNISIKRRKSWLLEN